MEYLGVHARDLVHQAFRAGQDGRYHLRTGHSLIEVSLPRGKAARISIAVEHVFEDLVDKRLAGVHARRLRGPVRATTATTTEEGLVGVVEVGIDLGCEIDGSDMLRHAAVLREQFGVEVDVGDAVARADSLDRVETPVDAEENAASGDLRGRLAEAVVVPRADLADMVQDEGRDQLMNVARQAVELVGDEIEGDTEVDVVGLVEVSQSLEGRPTKGGVAGNVAGERRGKVDVLGRER